MIVREITLADTADVAKAAKLAAAESPTYSGMTLSMERVVQCMAKCMTEPNFKLWVVRDDTGLIGLFGASVVNAFFFTERVACDEAIFINPQYRKTIKGGKALKLLFNEYQDWVRSLGGVGRAMIGISSGIEVERTARAFERMGAKRTGLLLELSL